MADFSVKDFLSGFKQPELYSGSNYAYVAIAKAGDNRLAIHIEPIIAPVVYKGNDMAAAGFALRIVEVGKDEVFGSVFGSRESRANFTRMTDGEVLKGYRLVKTFLPLTNLPYSGKEYVAFAQKALPKLIDFLKGKVAEAQGEMVVSDEELLSALMVNVEKVPTDSFDLFFLPGEKPEWASKPTPSKPPKAEPGEDEGEED